MKNENIITIQCAVLSTFYTAFDVALNAMCIDNKKHKTTPRIVVVVQITLLSKKVQFLRSRKNYMVHEFFRMGTVFQKDFRSEKIKIKLLKSIDFRLFGLGNCATPFRNVF